MRGCMSTGLIHRFDDSGKAEDLTKCFHYTQCNKDGKPIDWGPPEPELPDYNNDDFAFECDEAAKTCTVTLTNGISFTGSLMNDIVFFKSVPYAEPPVGNLRWKAPVKGKSFLLLISNLSKKVFKKSKSLIFEIFEKTNVSLVKSLNSILPNQSMQPNGDQNVPLSKWTMLSPITAKIVSF